MNFRQINVSEYFVIANDARHDKNRRKKMRREKQRGRGGGERGKEEKSEAKLHPGARARAHACNFMKRSLGSVLFGDFYATRARARDLFLPLRALSMALASRNNLVTFSIIAGTIIDRCKSHPRRLRIASINRLYGRLSNRDRLLFFRSSPSPSQ